MENGHPDEDKSKMLMRAMQLAKTGMAADSPLRMVETAVPQPGPGQVRIKVSVCGVCHTDLHAIEGDLPLPRLPLIPGHQVVGVVDKLGVGSQQFQTGVRVGVAWLNWACGECDYCQSGLENLCDQARFTGLHTDGGYAEYLVVDERYAYPLPPTISDSSAAPLLCAGIIGYRSLNLSGIKPGGKLGLYGFGASAHLAIQVARYWECQVYVFTRSPDHQAHALELGARWVGTAQEKPQTKLDAAVMFAPAGWIVPLALGHLRPGGTLAINAIHLSPIPELPYSLIYGERVMRSVANFTRQDAVKYLSLAVEIPVKTAVVTLPLAAANQALQKLKASQVRGAVALDVAAST